MQVTLRERNLDIGLAQRLLNGEIEIAQGGKALVDIADEAAQLEIERAVTETAEQYPGRADPQAVSNDQRRITSYNVCYTKLLRFDGTLNANGRIFLINQNGIIFGEGSQVNVGSLLATTNDMIDDSQSYNFV